MIGQIGYKVAKINPKAIAANERLLAYLDKRSIKTDKRQFQILKRMMANDITKDEAVAELVSEGFKMSGAAAKYKTAAIVTAIKSKENYVEFSRARGGLMTYRAKEIVNGGAGLISTAAKDLALEQVRATIVDKTPIAQGYIRVANAGACDFCASLDGVRVNSDAIDLHNGCGCTILPVMPF